LYLPDPLKTKGCIMSWSICPCCRTVVLKPFMIDLNTNFMTIGEREYKLPRQPAEILSVLAEAYPGSVSRESLIKRVLGSFADIADEKRHIRVQISNARRVLNGSGLTIVATQNEVGAGCAYRIVYREPGTQPLAELAA
jgi:DNA-binding response OmpR family regulator